MWRISKLIVCAIVFALATSSAMAQTLCGNHDDIVSKLANEYSETRVGIGLNDNGRVLELFASPTGTWTILITPPKGLTCMVETGQSWETIPTQTVNSDAVA